ncbi:MAG: bifunctional glutamate N-acetyltransferase/amino-acid acetyltransferase ArgJ [candidate division NC10 bacterium]|nr:bifunctional glutamate N-acetyltransferase/amino-acid acetyltransferase ArgJ [candidate division NC10 bacterium]
MNHEPIIELQGGITAVRGVRAAGIHCGIKKAKPDLALIRAAGSSPVAGVFTTSQVKAAPVLWCQCRMPGKRLSAIVVNSGNANACTGDQGLQDAETMAAFAAAEVGCPVEETFVCSTGVIGQCLPMDRIVEGIREAATRLREDGGPEAARAIMTTDTVPKEAAVGVEVDGRRIHVGGMAKGAGMIAPRMATMLAFLATDALVEGPDLQGLLEEAVERSFHRITVDGDTSTNDTVLCFATGQAGGSPLHPKAPGWAIFRDAVFQVTHTLAKKIVADGEGATKLVAVQVAGARSTEAAQRVAFRVANSPLVKTAFFAQDCNWGRIMAAIGSSGAEVDPDRVDIRIGEVLVVSGGIGLGAEVEEAAQKVMALREFAVFIGLNLGEGEAVVWTTDLSYDYIRANVAYRS